MLIRSYYILVTFLSFFVAHNAYSSKVENIKSLFSIKEVEVVSVSKTPEKAFEASSAIFVVTQGDINRAGATSIPEALRLVPGLEVTRMDSNKWAITSRGFNRQFVNKMLVLIDGRSVYTPLFSGIYWDVQDTVIEDIDRIEVIRGPGATLWGANAVNGVINIITKDARLTQGNFVSAIYGDEERGNISTRHGGKIGEDMYYRVFGKYFKRSEQLQRNGIGAHDEWEMVRTGMRIDWDKTAKDHITIQSDVYGGYNEQPFSQASFASLISGDEEVRGGNILTKWQHVASPKSVYDIQMYVDYIKRDAIYLEQERKTFDIEFMHMWKKIPGHEILWGMGYRTFWDNLKTPNLGGEPYVDYTPDSSYNNLYSGFVQDKYSVIPQKLFLTLGSKFEHNFYTDFEIQPNVRVAWLPSDTSTVWAAVSRAVRIPSRGERGISLVAAGTAPNLIRQVGGQHMDSEKLLAYELGYRVKPQANISLDVTAFYNDYDNLRSFEPDGTLNIPLSNKGYAETYGFEIASKWNITKNWSLSSAYNFLTVDMHIDSDSTDVFTEPGDEKASPKNQFKVSSHFNLAKNIEIDNMLYYVDNISSKNIDNYIRFDTRVSWKPRKDIELSIVGQNLLEDSHPEFSQSLYSIPTEIGRSVYGKVSIKF